MPIYFVTKCCISFLLFSFYVIFLQKRQPSLESTSHKTGDDILLKDGEKLLPILAESSTISNVSETIHIE